MKKKWICILVVTLLAFLLVGCGETNADAILQNSAEQLQDIASGGTFSVPNLPEIYYNFCILFRRWAAVIIVFSLLTGFLLFDIFRKNKEVQKWAVGVLIIRIPLITFVGIYVFAFLYGFLNT